MKKKSLIAVLLLLALSLVLAMFSGCGNATVPIDPAPESSSVPEPEPEPELEPTVVEGVVKEASPSKIIVTLADGTDFALSTTDIADLEVNVGDEVKVEYTGTPGSAVAGKVDVTKAAPVSETVTGVVKEVSASMMLLTLEDETEIVLLTKDIEGLEVNPGDTVTAQYTNDGNGAAASVVEVIELAEKTDSEEEKDNSTDTSSQSVVPASTGNVEQAKSESVSVKSPSTASGNSASSSYDPYDVGAAVWGWLGDAGYTVSENPVESSDDYESDSSGDNQAPSAEETPDEPVNSGAGDVYEAIRLINAERVKAGLSELEIDDDLMAAAAVRAEEMVEKFAHVRPDGGSWDTVFAELGVDMPHPHGENGGSGNTASKVVNGWMNSSGHKANILNTDVTRIGVGYCRNRWAMIIGG